MADYQSMFRQFGEGVSDAILGPLETKLSVMKMRKELEQAETLAQKRDAEKEKTRLRGVATESLRKRYGDEYADLYAAGETAGGLASLRRADAERIKAMNDNKKAKGERYTENFDMTAKMTQQANQILSGAMQKVAAAKASGNEQGVAEAMDQYTKLYDGVSDMLRNQVYSIDKDLRASYSLKLMEGAENALKELNPDKIRILDESIDGGLKGRLNNDVLKELDDARAEYGLDIDLSGVPSSTDIKKYAYTAIANKDLTPEEVKIQMNIKDPKDLEDIANSKDASMPARKLAAALLKQQIAADAVVPGISKSLKEMPYEELEKKAASTGGEGVLSERIKGMARKEIKKRGVKASDARPFKYNPLIPVGVTKKLFGRD